MGGHGPPPGWTGKVHALHQLATTATGDWLLFSDADVVLATGAVERAIAAMEVDGLDILSLYPQQELGTVAERVFVPMMVYYFFLLGPQWLHARGKAVPVLPLNGQFTMWRRSSYEALGGFARIPDAWLDDMAMGRLAAAEGLKARYRAGVGLARCRMYTGLGEAWRGFAKHQFDCLGLPGPVYLALHAWLAMALLAPFAFLPDPLAVGLVALILLTRVQVALVSGGGWWSAACHPLAMGASLLNGLYSHYRALVPVADWKGRTRLPDAGRPSPPGAPAAP